MRQNEWKRAILWNQKTWENEKGPERWKQKREREKMREKEKMQRKQRRRENMRTRAEKRVPEQNQLYERENHICLENETRKRENLNLWDYIWHANPEKPYDAIPENERKRATYERKQSLYIYILNHFVPLYMSHIYTICLLYIYYRKKTCFSAEKVRREREALEQWKRNRWRTYIPAEKKRERKRKWTREPMQKRGNERKKWKREKESPEYLYIEKRDEDIELVKENEKKLCIEHLMQNLFCCSTAWNEWQKEREREKEKMKENLSREKRVNQRRQHEQRNMKEPRGPENRI